VLDLRRLRALHAVVETGSVTAAAERVAYTPPAISQHIAALERETGSVLLERSGRGVRPTDAGLLLAGHADALLARMAEAEAAMAALRAGEAGVLRVVSFPTAGAGLVAPALAGLRRVLPRLEVELRVAEREESLPMLRQGQVDVAVVEEHGGRGNAADGLSWLHLLDDPYRLVLPRHHRLASRRVIDLDELSGEGWVETLWGTGSAIEVTQEAFRQAGFVPRRAVEATEYWPAQSFVAARLGVALIPTLALGAVHHGVVVRRLSPASEPVRHVWAVTRPAMAERTSVRAMIEALQAAASAHGRSVARTRRSSRVAPRTGRPRRGVGSRTGEPVGWRAGEESASRGIKSTKNI
jgi:DNA-binding transcriptional LysR family regulator